jgi:hypothetical protein
MHLSFRANGKIMMHSKTRRHLTEHWANTLRGSVILGESREYMRGPCLIMEILIVLSYYLISECKIC